MKCAVIARHQGEFPLTLMCRVLGVSRSAFYAWARRGPTSRHLFDRELRMALTGWHERSHRTYGRPRLVRDLRDAGYHVGHERVRRLMREVGIVGTPARRFRVTTQGNPAAAVAPNYLARAFAVGKPNRVWAADVTYCATDEGWLYLAVVLDVASRRVVGWAAGSRLTGGLVQAALDRALALRPASGPLLHHSDRGCQYTSQAYQAALAAHGIQGSMSRRGDCWDNAVVESFFATLKRELVHRTRWGSRAAATRALAQYLDGWYNRVRRHSSLGYRSPMEYEAEQRAA